MAVLSWHGWKELLPPGVDVRCNREIERQHHERYAKPKHRLSEQRPEPPEPVFGGKQRRLM